MKKVGMLGECIKANFCSKTGSYPLPWVTKIASSPVTLMYRIFTCSTNVGSSKGSSSVHLAQRMQLIINPCHTLRHNVKFSFSSMALHLISGQGSVSHAQRPRCACASIHSKPNRPQPGPRCHSEKHCRRCAINHDLMPNRPKQCKQFVDEAENEPSPYISALHARGGGTHCA